MFDYPLTNNEIQSLKPADKTRFEAEFSKVLTEKELSNISPPESDVLIFDIIDNKPKIIYQKRNTTTGNVRTARYNDPSGRMSFVYKVTGGYTLIRPGGISPPAVLLHITPAYAKWLNVNGFAMYNAPQIELSSGSPYKSFTHLFITRNKTIMPAIPAMGVLAPQGHPEGLKYSEKPTVDGLSYPFAYEVRTFTNISWYGDFATSWAKALNVKANSQVYDPSGDIAGSSWFSQYAIIFLFVLLLAVVIYFVRVNYYSGST